MQQIKAFVSILLIAVFGITLGAEAFASDALICSDERKIVSESDSSKLISAELHSTEKKSAPSQGTGNSCSDPCHFGRCHFGHCSFAFSGSDLHFHVADTIIEATGLRQSIVDAPFLEGPRRPPRLS